MKKGKSRYYTLKKKSKPNQPLQSKKLSKKKLKQLERKAKKKIEKEREKISRQIEKKRIAMSKLNKEIHSLQSKLEAYSPPTYPVSNEVRTFKAKPLKLFYTLEELNEELDENVRQMGYGDTIEYPSDFTEEDILKNRNRWLIEKANQKLDELIKANLISPAVVHAMNGGGYFHLIGMEEKGDIIAEIQRAETFLADETSDKDVAEFTTLQAKAYLYNKDSEKDIFRGSPNDEELKIFWEEIDRLRENDQTYLSLKLSSDPQGTTYIYAYKVWKEGGNISDAVNEFLDKEYVARIRHNVSKDSARILREEIEGNSKVRDWERSLF